MGATVDKFYAFRPNSLLEKRMTVRKRHLLSFQTHVRFIVVILYKIFDLCGEYSGVKRDELASFHSIFYQ